MNLDHLPEEIFALLEKKSYQALNQTEKDLVDPFLDASEYDDIHLMLQDFGDIDHRLGQKLEQGVTPTKKVSRIRRIMSYKIPAYQVAVVAILLIFVNVFFRGTDSNNAVEGNFLNHAFQGQSLEDDYYPDSLIFML